MSWELVRQVRDLEAGHVAKALLYALASRAGKDDSCYPSIATLARDSGLKERAVQRHLRILEQRGLIKRNDRRGRVSLFTLTLAPPDTGAHRTPVHESTGEGASHAPDPRTRDGDPVHVIHPKLKEKNLTSNNEVPIRESARSASLVRMHAGNPSVAWRTSNEGVLNKARELDVETRPGESFADLRVRVQNACALGQNGAKKSS